MTVYLCGFGWLARAAWARTAVVIVFRFERAASTAPASASMAQPVNVMFLVFDELRLKLIEPLRAIDVLSPGHREQGLVKGTGGRGERRCELQRLRNFGLSR